MASTCRVSLAPRHRSTRRSRRAFSAAPGDVLRSRILPDGLLLRLRLLLRFTEAAPAAAAAAAAAAVALEMAAATATERTCVTNDSWVEDIMTCDRPLPRSEQQGEAATWPQDYFDESICGSGTGPLRTVSDV